MKILSWNVNGLRAVQKKGFLEWFEKESPDILCLGETKASPDQLSQDLVEPVFSGVPYYSFWASAKKKGYSGVAIYSKVKPISTRFLGKEEFDNEGRVLIADYENFSVISAYFPNSQDGGKRLSYKLDFCDEILKFCENIVKKEGKSFILCGDYNIAHTPIDLARPKENEKNAGYLPEERAWMDKFTALGYIDTFRHFHPDEKGHYSWWSYRADARERNVGWRIDYHCVNPAFLPCVKSSIIRPEIEGSDHCPIEINLDL